MRRLIGLIDGLPVYDNSEYFDCAGPELPPPKWFGFILILFLIFFTVIDVWMISQIVRNL